jgi:O-methyltransferase
MMPLSLLHPEALLELLELAGGTPPGAFAEFGVYQGGAAFAMARLARAQARALFLLDTFTGIPYAGPHDHHRPGDFKDTSAAAVQRMIPEAHMIVGVFPESLAGHPPLAPLAFVHVDADQYASLRAAIQVFPPLMVPGGVMLFDDYGCLEGATRAVLEWSEPVQITRHGKAYWRKPAR